MSSPPPTDLPTVRTIAPRPPSPWPGSQHRSRHRWQLDGVTSLAHAADELRALAAELTAAHTAGWRLEEPMRSGHLLAARPSRRQRARLGPGRPPGADDQPRPPTAPRWRLRLVDAPPVHGERAFDIASAPRTPVLAWTSRSLDHVSGPGLAADVQTEMAVQLASAHAASGFWGAATARVGRPHFDLVAQGSALRLHAVEDGALVRTSDVLTFQHAADGAASLPQAVAAYRELATTIDAMVAAGGRLATADDGFLHVDYGRVVR